MEAARFQPGSQLEHLALGAPGIEAGDEQATAIRGDPMRGHLSKAGALLVGGGFTERVCRPRSRNPYAP